MTSSSDMTVRLGRADGLDEILDTAYEAFERMLALINEHQDPGNGFFVPMVLAAASAANGRDYIGWAPSLPRSQLHPERWAALQVSLPDDQEAADWIASLCHLLASRLTVASAAARMAGDRRACAAATQCAREIADLMGRRPE